MYTLLFFIFLVELFAIYIIFKSGIKSTISFAFIVIVQIIYLIITPLHNFIISDFYSVNKYIKDAYPFGFLILFIHLLLFVITYYFFKFRKFNFPKNKYSISRKRIFIIFSIFFIIIFLNTLSSGINLIDILRGKDIGSTLGLKGTSYFLQNFADSLITLLVASFIVKINKFSLYFIITLSLFLFLVLGFRYRIILSIFAILIYLFFINKFRIYDYLKILILFFSTFYLIFFITTNRSSFFTQNFTQINFNPLSFDYNVVYEQARGSVVDFAMYDALNKNEINYDFGNTMFVYIFIKLLPSHFFEFGEKPYPPPMLSDIDKSLSVNRDYGEACTILGAAYYSYSIIGVLLVSFILGYVISYLDSTLYYGDYYFLRNVMILMAIFQLITRGYFPQFVDHLVYMLFPLLFIIKKNKN